MDGYEDEYAALSLEPKQSKPRDAFAGAPDVSPDESPDSKSGRLQRELMAAAVEKWMLATRTATP